MRIAGGREGTLCKGVCGVSETVRLEQIVMIVTEGRIQPATKWRINNNEPKESV